MSDRAPLSRNTVIIVTVVAAFVMMFGLLSATSTSPPQKRLGGGVMVVDDDGEPIVVENEHVQSSSTSVLELQRQYVYIKSDLVSHLSTLEGGMPLAGESRSLLSVFVHGASRKQEALWWEPLVGAFANSSHVMAVDMANHGESPAADVTTEDQTNFLVQAIRARIEPSTETPETPETPEKTEAPSNCVQESPEGETSSGLILVGRSWGGGVVLRALHDPYIASRVRGIVLIAPSATKELVDGVPDYVVQAKIPSLLVWAKDDPIMPFETSEYLLSKIAFETLFFDKAIQDPTDTWTGHAPELVFSKEFRHRARQLATDAENFVKSVPSTCD